LIEAEQDAAQNETETRPESRQRIQFELLGTEEQEGRRCFLIAVIPNHSKKYLMKGRIWVDQGIAIVRMEGPAKTVFLDPEGRVHTALSEARSLLARSFD
jgi:hypothetical protein